MRLRLLLAIEPFLMMPLGAATALVWANSRPESYFRFAEVWSFGVNDIGMALFFAFIAQQVLEATMPGGELHTWRRSALPVVAALGGTLGAVGVYEAYVHSGDELLLSAAWPVVCAMDGALSYIVVRTLLRDRAAVPFVLLMVIVSDAIGLLVVGLHEPIARAPIAGGALILAGLGIAAILKRASAGPIWPQLLVSGPIVWLGFWWVGLHPALALIPVVPFLPRSPRDLGWRPDPPASAHVSPAHLEHTLRVPVQIVVFLFALVNAGTLARGFDTGTWAVLAGALVGRPLGILAAIWLSVSLGLHLPERLGWRELVVVALAASVGVTFGLFFAAAAVPLGPVLMQVKIGALLTAGGALTATMAAWLLGTGRFHPRSSR